MRRPLAALVVCCAMISACSEVRPVSVPTPAAERFEHGGVPGRPVGSGPQYVDANGVTRNKITDEENGAYLRLLRSELTSCYSKLDWLADWFKSLTTGR